MTTQEDREGAWAIRPSIYPCTPECREKWMAGVYDDTFVIRHTVRIRIAAEQRIVAWLREMTASEWNAMMEGRVHLPWAYGVADAIEAGEHLGN